NGLQLPINTIEFAFLKPDRNAAIDHRDYVGIGDVVENLSRTRTINATENHVAVERGPVPAFFDNAVWNFSDVDVGGSRALSHAFLSDIHFQTVKVLSGGGNQAVKIVLLDFVKIDEDNELHAHSSKRLGYQTAHAAEPHDADPEPGERRVIFLSPYDDRPFEHFLKGRTSYYPVGETDSESLTCATDIPTPAFLELPA